MSFSNDVREEIARSITDRDRQFACLYGILLYSRIFTQEQVVLQSESPVFARLMPDVYKRQVPHTGTFELEHAGGISAGKHGINCRIVQRDRVYGKCRFILLNGTDTVPDNCQVPQPQKVKFQQAHSFQNAHGRCV